MKFTPISKAFFGVPEEDESFDLDAATRVFKWYMADDTAEQVMVHTLAAEVPRLLEYHADEISKAFQKQYDERKAILKRAVIDGAISKSLTDERIEEITKAVDLIEKANDKYTIWERQDNARKQWRDKGGRFREMGTLNVVPPNANQKRVSDRVLNDRTPANHKPAMTDMLADKNQAVKYQNAYAQISAALESSGYQNLLAAQSWEGPGGVQFERRTMGSTPEDIIIPQDFGDKGRNNLRSVTFYAVNDEAARPDVFDATRAMGASRGVADEASYQFRDGGLNSGQLKEFNDKWATASAWDESGATRGFKRLEAASNFADKIFGNTEDPRIQAALAAGKWAGQYGPEAEKVIGPHARKSAYRYRGVERKADTRLNNAYKSAIATATTPTDARTRIIYPRVTQQVAGRGQGTRTVAVPVESPVINYMRSILPNEDLLRLHTNSGAIAPSQGIIIDRKGGIATQAVGYGDDHYLPFNLKNLKALKGGEYIRTRTLGGPTTEDVYTGMASGARAFTVVSHSGVYTVEFADDFRGGRRFNDKSARMVKRYGMLLDSLEAEQTTLSPVPVDRKKELMVKATGRYPGDDDNSREARHKYYQRLEKEEQQEPKPSAERKEEWAGEFLDEQAAKYDDGRGTELAWKDVRGQALARAARESGEDPDSVARQFSTNASTIVAIGAGEEYKNFLKKKERDYVSTQKPLRLNSEGYYLALQALQEQFPYYIANVEYRQWDKTSNQKDAGYVKPKFNRPANIKTGYWDPSIEGRASMDVKAVDAKTGKERKTGKISADETDYQNWTARQNLKTQSKESKDGEDGTAPGAPSSPAAGPGSGGSAAGGTGSVSLLTKAKYRAELNVLLNAPELRVRAKAGDTFVVAAGNDKAIIAKDYEDIMGVSADELKRRYVADTDYARRVDEQAKKAMADPRLDIPDSFKTKFDSGGRVPTVSFTPEKALTDNTAWFTFGDEADFTLNSDERTADEIQQFVDNDPNLIEATTYTGQLDLAKASASKISQDLSRLGDTKGELDDAVARGDFARPGYSFNVGGQQYTSADEARGVLGRLILATAKLRQAKRRYDEASKNENTPQNITRVVGFSPEGPQPPLEPGPNGTKRMGPNGTVPVEPGFSQDDWKALDDLNIRNAGNSGPILKKLETIRKVYLRRK